MRISAEADFLMIPPVRICTATVAAGFEVQRTTVGCISNFFKTPYLARRFLRKTAATSATCFKV